MYLLSNSVLSSLVYHSGHHTFFILSSILLSWLLLTTTSLSLTLFLMVSILQSLVTGVLEVSIFVEVLKGLVVDVEPLGMLLSYVPVGHNYSSCLSLLCRSLHDGGHISDMVGAYHPVHPMLSSQLEHLTCTSIVFLEEENMVKV